MEPNDQTPRKSLKGKGIDPEQARKGREEKSAQLRKEKRQDRVNIERRKFKIDDEPETHGSSMHGKLRNLDILPKKCLLLLSPEVSQQIEAAVYFRRILAADKFPPLDLVVESGVVIPTLVRYLSRYDAPLLQTECAWSITNIACGEARHIKCLVDNGAIQELLIVLNTTGALSLKEQILWALCNISTDEGGARFMMAIPDVLLVVLMQIGIYCPSYSRVEADSSMMDGERLPSTIDIFQAVAGQPPSKPTADYLPHRAVSRITQFEMNTIPSLSTMRHVTFICGNLARARPLFPSLSFYRNIVFALADMIQSPDDDIMLDICSTFIALCKDERSELTSLILEQGMVSRMKECLEMPNIHEVAVLTLCAMLRSTSLHRKIVLHHFQLTQLDPRNPQFNSQASNANIPNNHKVLLVAMLELFVRTDSTIARKDIVHAVHTIVREEQYYVHKFSLVKYLLSQLMGVLQTTTNSDLQCEAGLCLTHLMLSDGVALDSQDFGTTIHCLIDLLACSEALLVFQTLKSLEQLLPVLTANYRHVMEVLVTLKEQIEPLLMNDAAEIAQLATKIDKGLARFLRLLCQDQEGDGGGGMEMDM